MGQFSMENPSRLGHFSTEINSDAVIRTLASLLIKSLRQIDVVGRYGGEEFGIILLDTSLHEATKVIDRIREQFATLSFQGGEHCFGVTFSGGIASSLVHVEIGALVSAADQALYRAKDHGHDRIVGQQSSMTSRAILPATTST